MNEAQKRILLHAINHFGVEANVDKALEEMGELTTELSRRRLERFDRDKVAEEIADVLITVEKLRIIYGGAKVDRIVEKKLAALEGDMGLIPPGHMVCCGSIPVHVGPKDTPCCENCTIRLPAPFDDAPSLCPYHGPLSGNLKTIVCTEFKPKDGGSNE